MPGKYTKDLYNSPVKPTWCPGCGDFAILAAVKQALFNLEIGPHEVVIVSGIGCGSKLPDYIHTFGLMTLHGRPLPAATGIKLANPKLNVVVTDGDGDAYGIGGNHFLHTCRRNPNITHIVENNQIYALTKGQYSPTSGEGFVTTTSPEGAIEMPLPALAVAFAAGASFIARTSAGVPKHMVEIIAAAIKHQGYALVEVLQPCVTFNKVNTYEWYAERAYDVATEGHDPTDPTAAWTKVNEWDDRIPIGILYRKERPPYETQVPGLERGPVTERAINDLNSELFDALKSEYV
jgi:2-oxoglutarate ferredoxin oxidoreductase subunit beta